MISKKYFNFTCFDVGKMLDYKITNDEAQIIKYISTIALSEKMELYQEGGKCYCWLTYEKIVEDNPTLYVGEKSIKNMVSKLKDKGLLEILVRCQKGTMLKKSYFRITDKALNLMFTIHDDENIVEEEKPKEIKKHEKEEQEKNKDLKYQEILDYWNQQGIIKHKTISEKTIKKIETFIKNGFSIDSIKMCIARYSIVLKDESYYFNYKWSLEQFICQNNAILSFSDEGDKWNNYSQFNNDKKTIKDKYNINQNNFNSKWEDKTGGEF